MAGIEGIVASAVVKEAIRGLAAAAGSPMAKLWKSCKQDLEEMRGTLTLIEAGLRDAERRSGGEEAVRVWLRQLKAVARDISAALDKPPPPPWKSLYNQLKVLCRSKRCLIVLDDLWESDIEMLRKLKLLLRCGKKGILVKVIVTTRNEEIVHEMSTLCPYKLGPLSDDSCWAVFKQVAFHWKDEENSHVLEAVGKDIAKNCKGLPLAAHAVGSMLRYRTVDFWKATRDSNTWDQYSSHDNVLPSLRLSYEHMPSYLKPCFAYCAIFQKGSTIDKDKLIQQWITLDFIKPFLPNLSYKVQAEEYLREILATSLLQNFVSSLVTHEHAKASQHLIMHDLARSVAGDEALFLDCTKQNNSLSDSCHHVVVVRYDKKLSKSLPVKVRSLHFRDCGGIQLPGDAFSSTKSLHVLDITGCDLRKLPDPMRQLAYLSLEYLNLSACPVSALPESLGNLKMLRALNISGCISLRKLPQSVLKLPNLVRGCFPRIEEQIKESSLPNGLLSLPNFFVCTMHGGISSNILQLEGVNPAELEIKFLENVMSLEEAKKVNLASKSRLSKLFLSWTGSVNDHLVDDESLLRELLAPTTLEQFILQGYMGTRFPCWIGSATYLPSLSRIELLNMPRCTQLPSLGQLPNLQDLCLRALPNIKKLDEDFCGGSPAFVKLSTFTLQDMNNLEIWNTTVSISDDDTRKNFMFPNLHKLLIHGCSKLRVKPCPPATDGMGDRG
ncbi:hypothetical protein C2845_PM01G36050 [Panicum miliaceum]|uniref:NB-ARC domain-containing protein n=1 Tax=Panicum miliaceum TaxID=4540 RepID=A0A3L6TUY6_PANMI|nr:hypothetical protein C2845_PM01G36050 [Panicum miliaceum]